MTVNKFLLSIFIVVWFPVGVICVTENGFCLEPSEVLVVANSRVAGSVDLALHYMDVRSIPPSHLLELSVSARELMSREEYDQKIKPKVLERIQNLQPTYRIAAIVLIRGIPLKVAPPLSPENLPTEIKTPQPSITMRYQRAGIIKKIKDGVLDSLGENTIKLFNINMRAAVDSELALIKAGDYELDGWIENPYFLGFQQGESKITKDQVLLVTRLDGPDIATVYRIINDSIQAEKVGLQGKAYFDARWPMDHDKKKSGYTIYDRSIHRAAELVKDRMEVTLDAEEQLFGKGSCPEAALYCGWYSYAQYVDSFTWQKGSIGYHISSAECSTLRDSKRPLWCLEMLEKGVVATIGPVYEPYVQGFPLPELFFGYLVEGYLSLGECYLVSLPFLSWQTILIGDPLYQPFKPLPVTK